LLFFVTAQDTDFPDVGVEKSAQDGVPE